MVPALFETYYIHHSVTVVDNLSRGKIDFLSDIENFSVLNNFLCLDLSDPSQLESLPKDFDVVVHLADIVAGIGYVFGNEYSIYTQNNKINTNIIRYTLDSRIKSFLYVGTACSFPKDLQQSSDSILSESDLFPADPESAYGWSKLLGSIEMKYAFSNSDVNYTTLMLHNVYGLYTDINPATSQVIPSLIRRVLELKPGEPLTVWGDGSQSRAFLHASDVSSALVSLLNLVQSKTKIPYEYIQIGPSQATTIAELARLILDLSGKDNPIYFDTSKPTGDRGRSSNSSLANNYLQWSPTVSLQEGLDTLIPWIDSQLNLSSK